MQDLYYVIFSNSSRNNGGLRPQCRLMTTEEIVNSACFELNRQGTSFEDMAGIEFVEDESGDFTYARQLTEPEAFNFAIEKLADDGRLFDVFLNKDEFLINAEDFGLLDHAQQLV